jgi:hypothetical protein
MNISIIYTVQFIIRLVPADVMAMFLHRPTAAADNSQPNFPLKFKLAYFIEESQSDNLCFYGCLTL